ncbi:GTPase-activating protein, partial [Ceratobasidium sp. 423]
MADDEKRHSADHSTVAVDHQPQPKRKWFSSSKKDASEKEQAKEVEQATDATPMIPPVGFTELFRFSTPFELTLDAIGLVAAAAAGAAQPLMSLLFGRLTQDFVSFTTAIYKGGDSLEQARRSFEDNAAKNALYLVFIGIGMFVCTFVYMYFWIYTGE